MDPLLRYCVFVVLTSAITNDEVFGLAIGMTNYSLGNVRSQLLVNESVRVTDAGLYVLPDVAPCDGFLTEWRTCFFYNYEQNPPPVTFSMDVAILRLVQDVSIHAVQDASKTTLLVQNPNEAVNWSCATVSAPTFRIAEGDRIIVAISNECNHADGTTVCPMQPNINTSTNNQVLYGRRFSLPGGMTLFSLTLLSEVLNVHINLEAIVSLPPASTDIPATSTLPSAVPPASTDIPATSTLPSAVPPASTDIPATSTLPSAVPPASTDIPATSTLLSALPSALPPASTDIPATSALLSAVSSVSTISQTSVLPSVLHQTSAVPSDLPSSSTIARISRTISSPPSTSTIARISQTASALPTALPSVNIITASQPISALPSALPSTSTITRVSQTILALPSTLPSVSTITSALPEVTSTSCCLNSSPLPETKDRSQASLSDGHIVGIAVAGFAFLVIGATVIALAYAFIVWQRKHKGRYYPPSSEDSNLHAGYHLREERVLSDTYTEPVDSVVLRKKNKAFSQEGSTKNGYRQGFRNRGYSDTNAYSPVETDETKTSGFYENAQHSEPERVSPPARMAPVKLQGKSVVEDTIVAGHYEFANSYNYEDPYWEPASMEDELKLQLLRLKVHEIPKEQLQICEHLGRGQFGTVNRGLWQSPEGEREVAVKSLAAGSTEDERVKFLQEAAIMGQFKHPNVLRIYGVVTVLKPLMIVCEMMHKGDLRHHLQSLNPSSGSSLPAELPAMLLSYCRQLAAGMAYLASKTFIHRDLAARNILVSKDEVCMIADFGLSRLLAEEDFYVSRGGKVPVKWTAPEAVHYRKYSSASDVWSYGILLYEIWALGTKPYHTFTNTEALQKILTGYRLPPPPGCPREIYQLMVKCWHPEPESRPTFFDVLLALQRPDFQLLRWAPEDVTSCTQEAKILGGSVEDGKELYQTLQGTYNANKST